MPSDDHILQIDRIRSSARQIVRYLGFMHSNLAGTKYSASASHTIVELGYGTVDNAKALGELLHLEKSSVSRLLKKFESDGLLEVVDCIADKRMRTLKLTNEGNALLKQIEDFGRNQIGTALSTLTNQQSRTVEQGLFQFANSLHTDKDTISKEGNDLHEISIKYHIGYRTGIIAAVTDLHAKFYADNYNFGSVFESKVASELSEFMARIDKPVNTIVSAFNGEELLGSVSIDGEDYKSHGENIAHLRWFIVNPNSQGLGVGQQLLNKVIQFTQDHNFTETRLWTFKGLDAARHLYESAGFELVTEHTGSRWGSHVIEQEFRRSANNEQ